MTDSFFIDQASYDPVSAAADYAVTVSGVSPTASSSVPSFAAPSLNVSTSSGGDDAAVTAALRRRRSSSSEFLSLPDDDALSSSSPSDSDSLASPLSSGSASPQSPVSPADHQSLPPFQFNPFAAPVVAPLLPGLPMKWESADEMSMSGAPASCSVVEHGTSAASASSLPPAAASGRVKKSKRKHASMHEAVPSTPMSPSGASVSSAASAGAPCVVLSGAFAHALLNEQATKQRRLARKAALARESRQRKKSRLAEMESEVEGLRRQLNAARAHRGLPPAQPSLPSPDSPTPCFSFCASTPSTSHHAMSSSSSSSGDEDDEKLSVEDLETPATPSLSMFDNSLPLLPSVLPAPVASAAAALVAPVPETPSLAPAAITLPVLTTPAALTVDTSAPAAAMLPASSPSSMAMAAIAASSPLSLSPLAAAATAVAATAAPAAVAPTVVWPEVGDGEQANISSTIERIIASGYATSAATAAVATDSKGESGEASVAANAQLGSHIDSLLEIFARKSRAAEHHLEALDKLLVPCMPLRFLEWFLTHKDSFYGETGLWFTVCRQILALETTQMQQLLGLRADMATQRAAEAELRLAAAGMTLTPASAAGGVQLGGHGSGAVSVAVSSTVSLQHVYLALSSLGRLHLQHAHRNLAALRAILTGVQLAKYFEWVNHYGHICIQINV